MGRPHRTRTRATQTLIPEPNSDGHPVAASTAWCQHSPPEAKGEQEQARVGGTAEGSGGGGVFEVQRAQGGPETERLSGWLEHRGEGHVHSGPCRKRLHLTEDGVTKGVSRG